MNEPEFLTRKQLVEILPLSLGTIDKAVSGEIEGVTKLPRLKIGRRVVFRLASVRAWVAENEHYFGGSDDRQ